MRQKYDNTNWTKSDLFCCISITINLYLRAIYSSVVVNDVSDDISKCLIPYWYQISNFSIPNINISKYLIPYWYVDQFDIIGRPSLPTTRQPYNGPTVDDLVLWSLIRAAAVSSLDHSFVSGWSSTRIRFRANVFQSSTLTADGNLGRVAGTGDGAFQTSISAQGNELKV